MSDLNFLLNAALFASNAHMGQMRGKTGQPYVHHLIEVAQILSGVTDDPEVLAAALLHDVVEDTPVTAEELAVIFGQRVADLVLEVSEVSQPSDGNRAARKEKDRAHYASGSPEGQSIKLADLISNTVSIAKSEPNFAKVFFPEARALYDSLKKGDPELREKLGLIINAYEDGKL